MQHCVEIHGQTMDGAVTAVTVVPVATAATATTVARTVTAADESIKSNRIMTMNMPLTANHKMIMAFGLYYVCVIRVIMVIMVMEVVIRSDILFGISITPCSITKGRDGPNQQCYMFLEKLALSHSQQNVKVVELNETVTNLSWRLPIML